MAVWISVPHGHHKFSVDELWCLFKQRFMSSGSISTILRPRVQSQSQLLSAGEVQRTSLIRKLAGGSDRNASTNVCLQHTLESQTDWNSSSRISCAPRSAVNPIQSGWSKTLGSKKFSRQSETQPSNQFFVNFRAWNCRAWEAWDLKKACELDAAYVLAGPNTIETDCLVASLKAEVLQEMI